MSKENGKRGRASREEINARKTPKVEEPMAKDEPIEVEKEDADTIVTDTTINDDSDILYDPTLAEPVIEKGYTAGEANVIGDRSKPIPEPEFERPTINFNEEPQSPINDIGDNNGKQPPIDNPFARDEKQPKEEPGSTKNPSWDDMSKKGQTASAKHMAESAIAAYVFLHEMGKKYCTFDHDKLLKKSMKGNFDMSILNIPINVGENRILAVGEWLEQKNQMIGEVCVVSEEFKDEVRPLLIEIFKEQGWGMTPTQRLLFAVAMDAGVKAIALLTIRSEMNFVLTTLGDEMKKAKAASNMAPPPPQEQPTPSKPNEEVLIPEEVMEVSKGNYKEPGSSSEE